MSTSELGPAIPQEPENIQGRSVAAIAAAAVIVTIAGVVVAAWLLRWHEAELGKPTARAKPSTSKVGLELGDIETTGHGTRVNQRASADLERWRWVDRDAGIVAMPIDRAIDLVVDTLQRQSPSEQQLKPGQEVR